MDSTKPEKRLQAVMLAAALVSIGVSFLDILQIAPGLGGRFVPLLLGITMLYLLTMGQNVSRTRRGTAALQRKVDSLRGSLRKSDRPDARKPGARPPTYREIRWHGMIFRSQSEVRVARELDRAGVLFVPNCKIRLKTETHRQTREVDFLICHNGRWGILEVDGPHHADSAAADSWRDERFLEHGLAVSRYPASQCYQDAKGVVSGFLAELKVE